VELSTRNKNMKYKKGQRIKVVSRAHHDDGRWYDVPVGTEATVVGSFAGEQDYLSIKPGDLDSESDWRIVHKDDIELLDQAPTIDPQHKSMKYEVGQKVKVIGVSLDAVSSQARKSKESLIGQTLFITDKRASGEYEVGTPGSRWRWFNEQDFEPVDQESSNDPWDNLIPGETVLILTGDERIVLAVLPGVFLLSRAVPHDAAWEWRTIAEAKRAGFTIKGAEPAAPKAVSLEGGDYTAEDLRAKLAELES
jgi:hypothetical protein